MLHPVQVLGIMEIYAMNVINIGFSIHRPEMIPITEKIMDQHDIIYLEEPPDSNFTEMLKGSLEVDDYLMPMDLEYPEFSRAMCHLERSLFKKGKQFFQTDPFVESLLLIHESFANGQRPEDLDKGSILYYVYLAERDATGALLHFYKTSVTGTFEETTTAVRNFARADAARLRLRDSLRAQDIIRHIKKGCNIFIEAGMIHYSIYLTIWKEFRNTFIVRPLFLNRILLPEKNSYQGLYSPGDLLTLAYVFHPRLNKDKWESLQAARSVVYSKIIQKEENQQDADRFFHLKNERDCVGLCRMLNMGDCKSLYASIRKRKTMDSFNIVREYITKNKI